MGFPDAFAIRVAMFLAQIESVDAPYLAVNDGIGELGNNRVVVAFEDSACEVMMLA